MLVGSALAAGDGSRMCCPFRPTGELGLLASRNMVGLGLGSQMRKVDHSLRAQAPARASYRDPKPASAPPLRQRAPVLIENTEMRPKSGLAGGRVYGMTYLRIRTLFLAPDRHTQNSTANLSATCPQPIQISTSPTSEPDIHLNRLNINFAASHR